ncbi:GNAT family N-acetyltransferase [Noviherbaspirillum sp. 17J57-3]|uniref:GNAT family N-acetyltransferase n=2 Tax=Noviherbaspirillum galbum TaxID=2709383 RepID=A0A6B3SMK3_9BURK|nr:GNAT family N-acetyltransferase [Noviherbaspirillum galbum]
MAVNGDDAVTRFLPYASWQSLADAEAWHDRVLAYQKNGDTFQFVITLPDGTPIGTCLLFKLVEASARAELGYALARAHWGSGLMYEAIHAFVDRIFQDLPLHRLEAEIDPRNAGSARLLEKLGFVREGLLRDRWRNKGETTDAALYGLLRPDWEARPA